MAREIRHVGEQNSFKSLVERYKIMASPTFRHHVMSDTVKAVDEKLLETMKSLSKHPRDTGLLQESWQLPSPDYFSTPKKEWRIHLINTATVEGHYKRKHGSGKSLNGGKYRNYKTLKYLKFVDERTQFYSKQIRLLKQRNTIEKEFKKSLLDNINKLDHETYSVAISRGLIPYDRRDIGDF